MGQDGVVGRTLLPERIACVQIAESMNYVRKGNQCKCSLIGYIEKQEETGDPCHDLVGHFKDFVLCP